MQQVDDGVVIGIKGHSIGRIRPFPILFGDWPDTSNYPDVPWIVSGRREGYKLGQDQMALPQGSFGVLSRLVAQTPLAF